ncbi:MAG: helix-turn-helix transcriptional regulator [Oscillospiraceae bacterium]|nr:helix-turn-helix transcriptional regulator [Oscillospiraceae bacterium]
MADKNQSTPLTEAVYYILLSVTTPLHGYGIIQNVKELSKGRLVLAAGTLYGAINNLLAKGWIATAGEDERKKEYIITESGKAVLEKELGRLEELVKNGRDILKG